MLKVITWFSRKPGLDLDEFRSHWRNVHPEAVLALPGLRAYTQNPTADSGYAKGEPYCDGVAETWWDDLDTLHAHRGTPELSNLMADEDNFIDPARRHHLIVSEVVVTDGRPAPGALKQFTWVRRRDDLDVEAFQRYWRTDHAALAAAVPGMVRYVQNHAIPEQYSRPDGSPRQPAFDGAPVVWFDDLETARAAGRSDQMAATVADEPNFVTPGPRPWVMTNEIEIL